ncbi:MAG: hypothetical protein CK427_06190 [Leptospira sp.]|nr:MAG: hypothetical protein CK427_06190 [Leptospira sp.]
MIQLRDIIEIGKVTGFTNHNNFELHYLVYESDGPSGAPGFSVAGLELGFFAWSNSRQDAKNKLFEIYSNYLSSNEIDFSTILYQLGESGMEEWWGLYRQITYIFGNAEAEEKEKVIKSLRQELANTHESLNILKIDVFNLLERITQLENSKSSIL